MAGFPIVNAGNYDLQVDTGFFTNSLLLDDVDRGIIAGYVPSVTETNLVQNPNFEQGIINYSGSNAQSTVTWDLTQGLNSSRSIKATRTTSTGNLGISFPPPASPSLNLTGLPVTAGLTYTLSGYVYLSTSRDCDAQFVWYNSSGAVTGTTVDGTDTPCVAGVWSRVSATGTAPAGAVSVRITFRMINAVIGDTMNCDWLLFQNASSANNYFDGTQAAARPGYTVTSQQWNSTVGYSSSTVTWGLDSSYIPSDDVLDGSITFASVLESTQSINVKRGRRDIGDTFSAGTMAFTILDVSGIFNPFDENSPFYDSNQNVPGLAPMREVKLIRYDNADNPELLFRGYVINYDYNFALGGLDTVTVYCADQFYLLSQTYLDEFNPSAELSGARLNTVLSLPEVDFPTGASRDIATGTVELGHDASYTVNAGTNVLTYVSQINDTAEFGRVFMSREGVFTFQNRIGNTLTGSVADFHDDGTNIPYNGLGISFEADAVINRSVLTGLNGNTATAENATSIATYFIQTSSITNSLLHEQTSIDTAASYLLNPDPEARFTSVETAFMALTTAQRDTVATIEIGNTVTIEKTFPSGIGTTELAQELSVEGIEHYLDISSGHRVLISTAPTTIVFELILNDATYGTLDSLNVLG
tara:strand:- start:183 stop:2114 length:1932 start_codon:yes stop_codon:yes gene_type:complete